MMSTPTHAPGSRPSRVAAFTVVELLVVVSILVLLIALLTPALSKAREVARISICQSYLRQYVFANESYANDWNDLYVYIRTEDGVSASGGYLTWMSNEHFLSLLGSPSSYVNAGPGYSSFLQCPDLTRVPDRGFRGSYGMTWTWIEPQWGDTRLVVHRSRVRRPSAAAEISDGTDWHIMQHYANYILYWDIYGEDRLWSVAYRHNDGAGGNVAHFDGSANYLTKEQAWDDTAMRDSLWVLYDDR